MTRSDVDERQRQAGRFIPSGTHPQSTFRNFVCATYSEGFPIAEAVVLGAERVRRADPTFEPRFDPRLLTLGASRQRLGS